MKQPDKRLCAAAELVRQGAVFADVGTDHALLPVFLCQCGRVVRAYATDINEGPLKAAQAQIAQASLQDKITVCLTDGLEGLSEEGITDIAICGMGGELIVSILSAAPFVKNKNIRLILQPMTHVADLRRYLAREGFSVVAEKTAFAKGKCYFCLAAEYTGTPYEISRLEADFGKDITKNTPPSAAMAALIRAKIRAQKRKCEGLSASGVSCAEEEDYLLALCALVKE